VAVQAQTTAQAQAKAQEEAEEAVEDSTPATYHPTSASGTSSTDPAAAQTSSSYPYCGTLQNVMAAAQEQEVEVVAAGALQMTQTVFAPTSVHMHDSHAALQTMDIDSKYPQTKKISTTKTTIQHMNKKTHRRHRRALHMYRRQISLKPQRR
jgi:hypothetical protein